MLIGIDPLLGPELLAILRAMGHGDEIAIVDGNYPADAHGQRVVRMDGHDGPRIADAILSVMPLDEMVPETAWRPCVGGTQCEILEPVMADYEKVMAKRATAYKLIPMQAPGFYDRVKAAYAIVASGERRLYGNLILRKGVIHPE